MEKEHYMPDSYVQKLVWQQNFVRKLNDYATLLGIDAATLAWLLADLNVTTWLVQVIELYKRETNERVRFKDLFFDGVDGAPMGQFPPATVMPTVPTTLPTAGAFTRIRKLVKQIKANKNYNEAIGRDLGIIGAEHEIDWLAASPEIKATAQAEGANISFKKSHSDGIKLYSKRAGETDYSVLAVITHSPYHDNRPKLDTAKPETREYYAVYILNDEVVGVRSKVVSVVIA